MDGRRIFKLIASINNPSPWDSLIDLPESGPGCQIVVVGGIGWGGSASSNEIPPGDYIVFNCELFIPIPSMDKSDDFSWLSPRPSYQEFIQSCSVEEKTKVGPVSVSTPASHRSTLIVKIQTSGSERFWRITAYENDRRITDRRELVKGTYITSDSDIDFVPSGFAAVGRFALPNPFPAIYAYPVIPDPGTRIELGTVRPYFGQAGGGVEGQFVDPTGPWTVSHHARVLPKW